MLPTLGSWGGVEFYTYPLLMGLAWGICYHLGRETYLHKMSASLWNFFFVGIFLFAWLGAKLLFLAVSADFSYINSQNFWLGGGFVFYGGLIGAGLFLLAFRYGQKKICWTDLAYLVPIVMIGHGLGRIGCLMAGCCYGQEIAHSHWRHPVPLYESLLLFLGAFIFNKVLQKGQREITVIALYFGYYGLFRFLLEYLRGDEIRGFYGPFSTSQWISLFLVGLGLMIGLGRYYYGNKNLYTGR